MNALPRVPRRLALPLLSLVLINLVIFYSDLILAQMLAILLLTLYWRALGKMTESYTVFTHLENSGVIWAQKDHPPFCGNNPTDKWEPGRVYVDPYVIMTDSDIPPGPHPLLVGMYHFDTGERLPISHAEGTQLGDAMKLTTITVVEE